MVKPRLTKLVLLPLLVVAALFPFIIDAFTAPAGFEHRIILDPDPVLRQRAAEITFQDTETLALLNEIEDYLDDAGPTKGGIALPQLGIAKRGFVVVLDNDAIIMLNPVLTLIGDTWPNYEGCLSIPGTFGYVPRHMEVFVSYYDENWEPQTAHLFGIHAFAVQHEYDHLEGVLISDKFLPAAPTRRTVD